VTHAVWPCHRCAISTADLKDLLADSGVTVNRETMRKWVNRSGRHFAESRSGLFRLKRIIGRSNGITTASKYPIDRPENVRNALSLIARKPLTESGWSYSNRTDSHSDFWLPRVRSISSFAPPLSTLGRLIPPCKIRGLRSMET